jgi:hypothetical protein
MFLQLLPMVELKITNMGGIQLGNNQLITGEIA